MCHFWDLLVQKRGQDGPHRPPKKQTLFEEIAKADHSFQTLYFIKISYVLAELCFSVCMVFVNSVIRHSVFYPYRGMDNQISKTNTSWKE